MEKKKPELQDFGVTPEEYALYTLKGNREDPSCSVALFSFAVVVSIILSISFVITRSWWDTLAWTFAAIIVGWLVVGGLTVGVSRLVDPAIVRFKKSRLLKSPVISRIKQYEVASAAYQVEQEEAWKAQWEVERQRRVAERVQQEAERQRQAAERRRRRRTQRYWESLDGVEFEQELGKLFRARGYRVESTPTSGDQGIDLILRKNGKTTVVQCKAHKRGVGPAVARELYGSMVAYKADNAILACTGGFTKGVYDFVKGKPIRLISASDIVRVAEVSCDHIQDTPKSPPICPNHECGKTMVLREGKYSTFWGCPRYPNCRGTRDL